MGQHTAFHHVNDSIRELAPTGPDAQTWEFFCECQDLACKATVPLTLLEFDAHRSASPPLPITTHADER
jgi:hypothetical protein